MAVNENRRQPLLRYISKNVKILTSLTVLVPKVPKSYINGEYKPDCVSDMPNTSNPLARV